MTEIAITAEELNNYIQNKILLILDLRDPTRFMEGHIKGSANAK